EIEEYDAGADGPAEFLFVVPLEVQVIVEKVVLIELRQPLGMRERNGLARLIRKACGIPVDRADVFGRAGADIAHAAGAGIGSDQHERHGRGGRLRGCDRGRNESQSYKNYRICSSEEIHV